ncbi:hypothetical protein ACJX0J_036468 [Zea mays]
MGVVILVPYYLILGHGIMACDYQSVIFGELLCTTMFGRHELVLYAVKASWLVLFLHNFPSVLPGSCLGSIICVFILLCYAFLSLLLVIGIMMLFYSFAGSHLYGVGSILYTIFSLNETNGFYLCIIEYQCLNNSLLQNSYFINCINVFVIANFSLQELITKLVPTLHPSSIFLLIDQWVFAKEGKSANVAVYPSIFFHASEIID